MSNTTTPAERLPAHLAEIVADYNAATLPMQLMSKPALSWDEFWGGLLGLPDSTAEQLAREPDAPHFFLLGRRRFIRTADAVTWIEAKADRSPYVPRRNRTSGSARKTAIAA